ncbi:MAG TPA: pyridoxal 5'-phosphate synthase glutaminase subunit PdxT, partial [Propionibacteriaceae bacterium]
MSPAPRVGVVALQGGVREHIDLLTSLDAIPVPLRRPADLVGPDGLRVDAVVLPGGESSTIDRLLRMFGLGEPLSEAIAAGLPTLGTCAGLIQLAARIEDPAPGQTGFGVLDVTVRRNAFGRQIDSTEIRLETEWGLAQVAFIRAPEVVSLGAGVTPLASLHDRIVAVTQGSITGIAFHPELTG